MASRSLGLFRVHANVEVDDRVWEPAEFLVIAYSKNDAENLLYDVFFQEHPHDLCVKAHRVRKHIGMDSVQRGKTETLGFERGVLAGGETME